MPASDNPKGYGHFLKILSMDNHGLELRKEKSLLLQKCTNCNKIKLRTHIHEWFDIEETRLN